MSSTARRASAFERASGTPIDLAQYPFFTQNGFGRDWLSKRRHRAIAIGYPKECATYNVTWRYSSSFQAVDNALSACIKRLGELSKHLNKSCSCRLAALNNTVFTTPNELPFRRTLPAIALVKDKSGRKEILGYAETTGRTGNNQPFDFYTASSQKVCQGTYSLGKLSTEGSAHLDCFNGRIKGPALYRIAGFREGQAYGTALVNAGENQLIIVYGLPSEEFQKRRAELLSE